MAVLSLALAIAFGWPYFDTGSALVSEWLSSADASYGVALVAVASLLAWRRRALFVSKLHPHSSPVPGIAALGFGLTIYVVGTIGADVFVTRVSAIVVLAGILFFLAGPASARVMAAPLFFALLAIPLPTLVQTAVTLPLQVVASQIAEATLLLIGVPVVRDGNLLRLSSTTLQVAEACSGLRSLISLGALAVLLAWAADLSWAKRAVVVAAAVPIAVGLNGLRVAVTGMACQVWGPAAAADPWHSVTGFVTFAVSLVVLMAVLRLLEMMNAPSDDLAPAMMRV